jgi:hypothetical protein
MSMPRNVTGMNREAASVFGQVLPLIERALLSN